MPVFYQQQINENTRLGIWKIEETEEYFKGNVPQHRDVSHPHKRLQHLAGRFLLQYLFPNFPYELIQIADTRKPFLPGEQFHFSISHCGDYAAAIVSRSSRVGIDIEIPVKKILALKAKFLSEKEISDLLPNAKQDDLVQPTLLWSAKEAVYKWYGEGKMDFREHIHLLNQVTESETIECFLTKTSTPLSIHYRVFDEIILAFIGE
jgi:phosphopantetheinyl transferase